MGKSASKQFNKEVLMSHNEYRKKHQAKPLKLSSNLCTEVARHAESLASTSILKHSAESSKRNYGESLARASYDQTGKDVTDCCYNEENQYNFKDPGFSSGT
ncbi:Golgi-associated plant pathogenesis-related protein 1, partial [Clarias magur]